MHYPFDSQPSAGTLKEVCKGVFWLTMPLPFDLDHINLYIIEDNHGYVIVDTGIGLDKTKALWTKIFSQLDKPIVGVLVTHLHPDHIGLAGWIADTYDVPFYMSQVEYFTARAFTAGKGDASPVRDRRYFHRAGLGEEQINRLTSGSKGYSSVVSPIPLSYKRLKHGDVLIFNDIEWKVIIGRGHSPEHVCLYSSEKQTLIAGDHILPIITPNIGAYSTEPEANTLDDYLTTLPQFKALPASTLVLPAHKLPFYGLHERVDTLLAHHQHHLEALISACKEKPCTVVDLLPVLFKRTLSEGSLIFAVAECLSHLNYLLYNNEITRCLNAHGVYEFETK